MEFIHENNQQLLWETLHKVSVFKSLEDSKKVVLFKDVIESSYNENINKELNYNELQKLNKRAISEIVKNVKKYIAIHASAYIPDSNSFVETPEERSMREFDERQKQYKLMSSKPDTPDSRSLFQEQEQDDGVITNMDELIEKYKEQRIYDLSFSPQSKHNDESVVNVYENNQETVNIYENNQEIVIRIERLESRIKDLNNRISELENNTN